MAKAQNAFFDGDFAKAMSDLKFPYMDVEAMMAYHRRNFDALTQANQVAVEGFQAIARRQGELIRTGAEEYGKAARAMFEAGTPEEKAETQGAIVKDGVENAVRSTRELTTMFQDTATKAADVMTKRAVEGLDEVRAMFGKNGAAK